MVENFYIRFKLLFLYLLPDIKKIYADLNQDNTLSIKIRRRYLQNTRQRSHFVTGDSVMFVSVTIY